ncbi:iron-containing alcohol dehydrogenase [Noviherbaspirillum saxi]|uniref:Iron-containing alcohol dehydrogenase n=1 Tax=Noviherbaspirillum saxi TaxID=2320863 RepID=A0A3A3FXS0_9BURK|nr:iron-containing alcohol dehydrogenase [Noviherbaspirillum saxi]RJF91869.1 iron-containing alcohol dehydrogenase [Noviherbaspirillum saxi]
MTAFEFSTVPSIIAEYGAMRRFGVILRERFAQERLCLITDRFLRDSGLLAPALASLHGTGWKVTIIDDVVADPPEEVVLAAAERALASGAELIVGFGGGSSMDVAKLIAALLGSNQSLQTMYGVGNITGPRLPLVQVPTTAGTGSEVTPISIVTTGATTKAGVVSPMLYADLTVLDAELTVGLPPHVTAATGIDAIVHAIEAYTSRHKKNPLSDMLAREALRLLSTNLLPVFRNGSDRKAREAMLLGAMLAGQAFANAPVAAVHALAYPIGGIFHVPHGLSNSLVLPHVLRFNAPAASALYSELAEIVVPNCSGSDEARCHALIQALEGLAAATGIERKLREVGISDADLPRLASDAMLQTRLLVNNPREVSEVDALAIYLAAY